MIYCPLIRKRLIPTPMNDRVLWQNIMTISLCNLVLFKFFVLKIVNLLVNLNLFLVFNILYFLSSLKQVWSMGSFICLIRVSLLLNLILSLFGNRQNWLSLLVHTWGLYSQQSGNWQTLHGLPYNFCVMLFIHFLYL